MKEKIEIWLLRLAVAFPLAWAGISEAINPSSWIGFVPPWLDKIIDPRVFLTIHGIGSIVIALGLIIRLNIRHWGIIFAGAAFLDLASILIFYGVDDITFRDVGLALVALVLVLKEFKPRHLSSVG
ncbi:MAG: hypothetical protein HYS89_00480 [Candidatus Colwellbacteria bacterium]|nr:hypothetical protein [Candidatus Colwellbacteria bacterium]